jgi:acetyl esterase/lipase
MMGGLTIKLVFLFLVIGVFVFLTACGQNPNEEDSMKNIPYGSHARRKLDIALPPGAGEGETFSPALCIHGGGWNSGDKSNYDYLKSWLFETNLAYVSMNYRLLGDGAAFFDMLEDIHTAIGWLQDHGGEYHLKTDKISLIGYSAGGHLALLYAYTKESPAEISLVLSQAGPADFLDPAQLDKNGEAYREQLAQLTGTPISPGDFQKIDDSPDPGNDPALPEALIAALKGASPGWQVTSRSPPTVMAYGQNDELVAYTNAERLAQALETNGIDHVLIGFPNSGHGLNNDPASDKEYWQKAREYLTKYLAGNP